MAVQTQPKSTGASELPVARETSEASIDLYWLPLGAGGWFVRLNGRIYEAVRARREQRRPLDLYHSALEVRVPEGRFVIENSWPIPDAEGASRGVAVEGPVGSRWIARFRVFRYEVRRWRDGIIPDADEAVASPQRLSEDARRARRILDLVGSVPRLVWGRDESGTGEMWNSNSVISWLVARSGLPTDKISPPAGGRAPGWETGLVTARRQLRSDEELHHRTAQDRQDGIDHTETRSPRRAGRQMLRSSAASRDLRQPQPQPPQPLAGSRKEWLMKVLIAVASKHGSTEEIAREIASTLEKNGLRALVSSPEEVRSVDEYDAVVLGSAVYAGRWMKEANELVDRLGDALAQRPVWLLSSGPIGDPPKPEEDPVDVAEVMERTGAREHRVFAGKLVKKGLSFGEKAIVLALRAPEGDFRDWDEIRSWAGEIAEAVQKQGSKEAR